MAGKINYTINTDVKLLCEAKKWFVENKDKLKDKYKSFNDFCNKAIESKFKEETTKA